MPILGVLSGGVKIPTVATAAAYKQAFFDSVTSQDFTNVLDTNSVGPYWLTFAFLPLLEKWKTSDVPAAKKFVPQIVMTSSMNGWTKVRHATIVRVRFDSQLPND